MRTLMWGVCLVFAIAVGAFVTVPGEQRDALFAEIDRQIAEDGPMGLVNGVTDGTLPKLVAARITELREMATRQIDAELSSIEDIRSGALTFGTDTGGAVTTTTQAGAAPHISVKTAAPAAPATPVSAAPVARAPISEAAGSTGKQEQIRVPQTEDIFTGIISRDDRENQAAETEFWTDAQIQEALENGEPTSGGKRMCLFGCD